MRIQQDAIPGREIPMWFTPVKELETFVVCGQLCGENHSNMIGRMEVVAAGDFQSWFDAQSAEALGKNRK
jgi:cytochrome c oxidase subunit 2